MKDFGEGPGLRIPAAEVIWEGSDMEMMEYKSLRSQWADISSLYAFLLDAIWLVN